jgi:LPXTG-motif cell wall-anchored protein
VVAAALPVPAPVESSGSGTPWYLLIALVVAAMLFFVVRRRKDGNQPN